MTKYLNLVDLNISTFGMMQLSLGVFETFCKTSCVKLFKETVVELIQYITKDYLVSQ